MTIVALRAASTWIAASVAPALRLKYNWALLVSIRTRADELSATSGSPPVPYSNRFACPSPSASFVLDAPLNAKHDTRHARTVSD